MKLKQILKTKLIPIALVAITLLLLLNITATAEDSWVSVASMSTARRSLQTEVINGKIYAIGGIDGSTTLSSVESYDPDNDTWTTLSSMPTARYDLQTEVIAGKIYALGGNTDSLEVYDPSTDTWTTLSSMSTQRSGFQTEVIDGKIYAIGGSGYLASAEVYNPSTDTWTTLSSMSTGRLYFQTEVIDSKIYVIGGQTDNQTTGSSVEVYDTDTDTWTTLSSMSAVRQNFQTEMIDGKIYAAGGRYYDNGSNYTATAEVYNPSTDIWTTISSMSTARGWFQTKEIDGKIYAIGGVNDAFASSLEVYDPDTDTWTALSSMSTARGMLQIEEMNGSIYAIGGYNSSSTLSSVERYTVSSSTTPDDPTDGNALLRITMITGESKEYDMSASAVNSFISWYNSGGTGNPSYSIAKNYNIGSLSGRTDNVAFKKIAFFEVMAYNTSSTPDTSTKTALLKVTMATDDVMEYEMSSAEISAFTNWYDSGASASPSYSINKTFNIGPFASRTDYLTYDMISDYEIMTF